MIEVCSIHMFFFPNKDSKWNVRLSQFIKKSDNMLPSQASVARKAYVASWILLSAQSTEAIVAGHNWLWGIPSTLNVVIAHLHSEWPAKSTPIVWKGIWHAVGSKYLVTVYTKLVCIKMHNMGVLLVFNRTMVLWQNTPTKRSFNLVILSVPIRLI